MLPDASAEADGHLISRTGRDESGSLSSCLIVQNHKDSLLCTCVATMHIYFGDHKQSILYYEPWPGGGISLIGHGSYLFKVYTCSLLPFP